MKIFLVTASLIVLTGGSLIAQTQSDPVPDTVVRAEEQASTAVVASDNDDADPKTPAATSRGDADEQPSASLHNKSGDHMFGVLPYYATVENGEPIAPIHPLQKFKLVSLGTFDPNVFAFVGVISTFNHTYGTGGSGYLKQYSASFADNTVGNFMTGAVLPSLLHQDPRYFERGSGGFLSRALYAASRSAVTRGDSGHAQFNLSEIGGNAIAAGLSNVYYPSAERTLTSTLSRWGMQIVFDTLANELKEFWPDVRRKLHGQ